MLPITTRFTCVLLLLSMAACCDEPATQMNNSMVAAEIANHSSTDSQLTLDPSLTDRLRLMARQRDQGPRRCEAQRPVIYHGYG